MTIAQEIGDAFRQIIHRTHDTAHMQSDEVKKAVNILSQVFGDTISATYAQEDKIWFMYYTQGLWDAWLLTAHGEEYYRTSLKDLGLFGE